MKRLPSDMAGRYVSVILNSGHTLKGKCLLVMYDSEDSYLFLSIDFYEYKIEAEAIAAIGVNLEGEA